MLYCSVLYGRIGTVETGKLLDSGGNMTINVHQIGTAKKGHDFSNPENWTFAAVVVLYSPVDDEHALMIDAMLKEMVSANDGDMNFDVWDESTARSNAAPNSRFANKSTCDHCGAHFHYGAAYRNSQGEYAIVGNTCASKNLNITAHEYVYEKARSLVKRENNRVKADLAMSKLLPNRSTALNVDHHICRDIKSSFRKYHSLTLKQWALIKKIAKQKALEPTPVSIPSDLLEGRHQIAGVLLGTKKQENIFGLVYKILVRDDRGFKLYGTRPDSLSEANKGDKISFFAAIKASDDDPCFGFFKRPTKAALENVEQGGENEPQS
jgi:hypothetical protein